MCNNQRSAPVRSDAFHGHGFSLLTHKVRSLRGLQTRAVPIGVTARPVAELVRLT
jgi:cellobiose phosphorylase